MNKEGSVICWKRLSEKVGPSEKEIDSDFLGATLVLEKYSKRFSRRSQSRIRARQTWFWILRRTGRPWASSWIFLPFLSSFKKNGVYNTFHSIYQGKWYNGCEMPDCCGVHFTYLFLSWLKHIKRLPTHCNQFALTGKMYFFSFGN